MGFLKGSFVEKHPTIPRIPHQLFVSGGVQHEPCWAILNLQLRISIDSLVGSQVGSHGELNDVRICSHIILYMGIPYPPNSHLYKRKHISLDVARPIPTPPMRAPPKSWPRWWSIMVTGGNRIDSRKYTKRPMEIHGFCLGKMIFFHDFDDLTSVKFSYVYWRLIVDLNH